MIDLPQRCSKDEREIAKVRVNENRRFVSSYGRDWWCLLKEFPITAGWARCCWQRIMTLIINPTARGSCVSLCVGIRPHVGEPAEIPGGRSRVAWLSCLCLADPSLILTTKDQSHYDIKSERIHEEYSYDYPYSHYDHTWRLPDIKTLKKLRNQYSLEDAWHVLPNQNVDFEHLFCIIIIS